MKHQIITKLGTNYLVINIQCNDECNNGHDSWAITGELYRPFERGDRKDGDRKVFDGKNYTIDSCGRIHDVILQAKKSLKPFVDLHLSDGNGLPMYAVANGYYHLQGVRGEAAHGHTCTLKNFADYMRIDVEQAQQLVDAIHTEEEFSAWVDTQCARYKQESEAAKEQLRTLMAQPA